MAAKVAATVVPCGTRAVEHVNRAHHIGVGEDARVGDGAVHVRLGREIDDVVRVVLLEQRGDALGIANVDLLERIARVILDISKVLQVASVSQDVDIDDADVIVSLEHIQNEVGTDETSTAGYEIGLHECALLLIGNMHTKQF